VVMIDHLSRDAGQAPAAEWLALREAPVVDERAARRSLRDQIARLERELAGTLFAAFPHVAAAPARSGSTAAAGPRLLGLGELERVRDDLVERVRRARVVVAERAELEADARALLEEMLRDPARHKWVRVPLADLGRRGCGAYQVRPRLGLVGMLMGWWRVKLSSGCPLAG
jgi:hypothetical protein